MFTEFRVSVVTGEVSEIESSAACCQRLPTMSSPPSMSSGLRMSASDESDSTTPWIQTRTPWTIARLGFPNFTARESAIGMR